MGFEYSEKPPTATESEYIFRGNKGKCTRVLDLQFPRKHSQKLYYILMKNKTENKKFSVLYFIRFIRLAHQVCKSKLMGCVKILFFIKKRDSCRRNHVNPPQ